MGLPALVLPALVLVDDERAIKAYATMPKARILRTRAAAPYKRRRDNIQDATDHARRAADQMMPIEISADMKMCIRIWKSFRETASHTRVQISDYFALLLGTVDRIYRRFYYLLLFRLSVACVDAGLSTDGALALADLVLLTGPVTIQEEGSRKELHKLDVVHYLRKWIDGGERYELLSQDLGGPGTLFLLPKDIGETVWLKLLPKTTSPNRIAMTASLEARQITGYAAILEAHTAAENFLDFHLNELPEFFASMYRTSMLSRSHAISSKPRPPRLPLDSARREDPDVSPRSAPPMHERQCTRNSFASGPSGGSCGRLLDIGGGATTHRYADHVLDNPFQTTGYGLYSEPQDPSVLAEGAVEHRLPCGEVVANPTSHSVTVNMDLLPCPKGSDSQESPPSAGAIKESCLGFNQGLIASKAPLRTEPLLQHQLSNDTSLALQGVAANLEWPSHNDTAMALQGFALETHAYSSNMSICPPLVSSEIQVQPKLNDMSTGLEGLAPGMQPHPSLTASTSEPHLAFNETSLALQELAPELDWNPSNETSTALQGLASQWFSFCDTQP